MKKKTTPSPIPSTSTTPCPNKAHEALCRRCGKCCYEKLLLGDVVVMTATPCQYLEEETMTCTVYHERHAMNLRCLSVEDGIDMHAFPDDCPYVAGREGYRGPIDVDTASELVAHLEAMMEAGEEPEVDDDMLAAFLNTRSDCMSPLPHDMEEASDPDEDDERNTRRPEAGTGLARPSQKRKATTQPKKPKTSSPKKKTSPRRESDA